MLRIAMLATVPSIVAERTTLRDRRRAAQPAIAGCERAWP